MPDPSRSPYTGTATGENFFSLAPDRARCKTSQPKRERRLGLARAQ
jgi:hypothetical protein